MLNEINKLSESFEVKPTIYSLLDYMLERCTHIEHYNSLNNRHIDFLCSVCTQKYTNITEYVRMAEEIAASQRALRRPSVKIRRGKRLNRTLSTFSSKKKGGK